MNTLVKRVLPGTYKCLFWLEGTMGGKTIKVADHLEFNLECSLLYSKPSNENKHKSVGYL